MSFSKDKLPLPPEFPASNASYNSIAGKLHKAAVGAKTMKGALEEIAAITAKVKGVNTYAKKVRRYADDLVAAIKAKPVEPVAERVKENFVANGVAPNAAEQKRRAEGLPA